MRKWRKIKWNWNGFLKLFYLIYLSINDSKINCKLIRAWKLSVGGTWSKISLPAFHSSLSALLFHVEDSFGCWHGLMRNSSFLTVFLHCNECVQITNENLMHVGVLIKFETIGVEVFFNIICKFNIINCCKQIHTLKYVEESLK